MFKDEDIFEAYLEEIVEIEKFTKRWDTRDNSYPHKNYDYSTDDLDDYEYQQDLYG
jgi:hypothetical protein